MCQSQSPSGSFPVGVTTLEMSLHTVIEPLQQGLTNVPLFLPLPFLPSLQVLFLFSFYNLFKEPPHYLHAYLLSLTGSVF